MNRFDTPGHSPIARRGSGNLRLPWLAVVAGLFACSEHRPPEACSVIPELDVLVGEPTRVQLCFEDPEGGTITLSVSSSNREVATAAVQGSVISIEAVSPGSATITVVATDPDAMTAELSFGVSVPNQPPRACEPLPRQEMFVRQTALVQPCFGDPEGQEFTLSASSSDPEVATVAVLGLAVRTKAVSPGTATVTVVAMDPGGLSATMDFQVTVTKSGPG